MRIIRRSNSKRLLLSRDGAVACMFRVAITAVQVTDVACEPWVIHQDARRCLFAEGTALPVQYSSTHLGTKLDLTSD